jgi:hypothetical protein
MLLKTEYLDFKTLRNLSDWIRNANFTYDIRLDYATTSGSYNWGTYYRSEM